MNDLLTARSITHAQQMSKVLERFGIHHTMKRASPQMTKHGCGYVIAVPESHTEKALSVLHDNGIKPIRVIYNEKKEKDGVLP